MLRGPLQPDPGIPSPSRRLWVGLAVVLAIFVAFAIYTTEKVRWLEDFQASVVQANRKASLQLLRMQNDAYLVAISLRDMVRGRAPARIRDWQPELTRLGGDMADAFSRESQVGVNTPASRNKRIGLRAALAEFDQESRAAFALSGSGREAEARALVENRLEKKCAEVSGTIARLLVLNDEAQAEAARRIGSVYGSVKEDIWIFTAILAGLALATGLYTFEANRKTFERLQHLAAQLRAQSLQLRKLSWKLIDVQEETLRQVARDLHDEFGQILTAIGLMLRRVGGRAEDADLREEVERVKQMVEQTLERVRDQSQMFRPAILDDFGLAHALDWFVKQFASQTGLEAHFAGSVRDGALAPGEAIHVYRIVQEALSNVARHAAARQVQVSLSERSGELHLEIRDDGVGFDAPGRSEGTGLMGMTERAEHLGGSMTVDSAPGRGTIVRVRVPAKLSAQASPPLEPAKA